MPKRCPQRNLSDLAEAFSIFAKYPTTTTSDDYETRESTWGTIDGDICIDVDPAIVSTEDKTRLVELGWVEDVYYTFCFNTHLGVVYDD